MEFVKKYAKWIILCVMLGSIGILENWMTRYIVFGALLFLYTIAMYYEGWVDGYEDSINDIDEILITVIKESEENEENEKEN